MSKSTTRYGLVILCLTLISCVCELPAFQRTATPTAIPSTPLPPTVPPTPPEPTEGPSPAELLEMLEAAYDRNDEDLLLDFFLAWKDASVPRPEGEIANQPKIVQAAYEIYGVFYTPFDLERIGDSEWGPGIYEDARFVIVQSDLVVRMPIGERRPREGTPAYQETIPDFRPNLEFPGTGVLYLTEAYRQSIEEFLDLGFDPKNEDFDERLTFLNQFVGIWPGHWGGWHIETHPFVESIAFDPGLTEAVVNFRLIYQGGEARFVKTDGQWEMIDSRLTWIE